MYKNLTWGVLAAVLLTTACGDDGPAGTSGDELTEEEAQELAMAFAEIGFVNVLGGGQAGPQSAPAQGSGDLQPLAGEETYTQTLELTRPCPLGGDVGLEAEFTVTNYPDEERVVADLTGTQTHDQCRVRARGRVFEITGHPNLTWTMHLEAVQGELVGDLTVDFEGGFTWSNEDGRSGECSVDLAAVINVQEQTATLSGNFCAITIESTATWTGPEEA